MDPFEKSLQENVGFEGDEDPNTFEEFLELEEYINLGHLFITDRIFNSKDELVEWAKQIAMNVKTYLIITRYQRARILQHRPYIMLACERGGSVKKYKKPLVDDKEEEIPKKRCGPYGTKKCGCLFKLKGEQMATCENWQLFVHNGRHNHKIVVYNHGHAQSARLTEEQLQQTNAQKIYNVVAKIRRNRMQGRSTLEEVLCLSAERGYTVFHRNREDSNVISDIVVAHPTSIAMIRTWPYVLIMDTRYKTNKVLQQIKYLYFTSAMSNGQGSVINEGEPLGLDLSSVAFWVETTNRAGSEHSVLKLWLSTCHGDLDTVFLNIDSLIHGQIAEIKYTLEISRLKEKYVVKSNPIMKNLSNKMSHLDLKKIMDELKKAHQMVEEPGSNCLHYLRKSYDLPCACELINRCQYLIPIQEEDVDIFWRKLEIVYDIPEEHDRDMESEMCDLTSLLQEISIGPISNPLSTPPPPPQTAVTKGRRKKNSTKRDKSHWEYVSIAHRKIGKSSDSGSASGNGSCSNPSPRGKGRPPCSGRGRGRGRSSGRSSLSSVVSPDSPPVPFPFNNAFPGFMYQFIQNWKNVVGDSNCGFRVVSNFLFGYENHWVEIRRRMSYDLRHRMNVYEQLFGSVERVIELIMKTNWEEGSAPPEYWMDTPDHFYVIANTFNLCIVLLARSESTTVLPLVSNMDGPAETIFIGLIEELQHFIQIDILLNVFISIFFPVTVGRWMPFAPITGAIGLSSRYTS
ncbi:hypothetical protein M9H77_12159 [Catharanthus roseus]|uniref:Uncharacterized protein n=1 Tax=Catharanthus roseus TaxID=4058 RepID=A0ACC0BGJ9_CATRO|nr:hypothetical protein M9H77_12159 [Catharanthus roseus]